MFRVHLSAKRVANKYSEVYCINETNIINQIVTRNADGTVSLKLDNPKFAEARKLYQDVFAAQDWAIKELEDGACGKRIHQGIVELFEERGSRTEERDGSKVGFFHGTGHGVGLDIHENPRLGKVGHELKAGHVITIEPGLYYPGVGGVRIEDLLVVTEDGHHNLTSFPKGPETFEI